MQQMENSVKGPVVRAPIKSPIMWLTINLLPISINTSIIIFSLHIVLIDFFKPKIAIGGRHVCKLIARLIWGFGQYDCGWKIKKIDY